MTGGAAVMQRWDDLTDDEQARYADREQLLAHLAAVTQRTQEANQYALGMEEAAVSALRIATDSTPGKGTGVWVPLERWQELQVQLANDYYKRRTEELAAELHQIRTELAGVLETAIMRGESLGYTTTDDDYRARLQELDPDAEILQDNK
jgi:hypothetical protein